MRIWIITLLTLLFAFTGFVGAEVYVKNRLFKGRVSGSGHATMVQADALLKALQLTDYKLESDKLVVNGKILPIEDSMVSLKSLSEAVGANVVVNAGLGTVDVYQGAKKGTGDNAEYNAVAKSEPKSEKREYHKPVEGWTTDLEVASRESKRTGKPIMMNFTGSDWCGWCIKLKAEVFDTPYFKKWASEKVVLLEVDFPRGTKLPEAIQKRNDQLGQKYGVTGYPRIVWVDHEGNQVGTHYGYGEGGPEAWTKAAESNMRKQ